MPSEASALSPSVLPTSLEPLVSLKCTLCGLGQAEHVETADRQSVSVNESLCQGCQRTVAVGSTSRETQSPQRGLESEDVESETSARWSALPADEVLLSVDKLPPPLLLASAHPQAIPPISYATATATSNSTSPRPTSAGPHSLPIPTIKPWSTASLFTPTTTRAVVSQTQKEQEEKAPNPLLDVTNLRVPSLGRGCLYPGSVFRGHQTSGRSSYDVQVKLTDVSFSDSTLSGYLSISHLTDTHPHLTTFFSGEIIGPRYGFLTGPRYQATEHDDMRHWSRFEQFRRSSTRADMVRPDLTLRDPLPDCETGRPGKERSYAFMRWKEQFLVPDHKVRDISGASFAGFYYIVVDLCPPEIQGSPVVAAPRPRRRSSSTTPAAEVSTNPQSPSRDAHVRPRIRERTPSRSQAAPPEPVLRGYYFHHLNQEPYQELSLKHVPERASSTFELR